MSRRPTNAPPPILDPDAQIIQSLQIGAVWATELGKMLSKTDARDWSKRKMVIAALVYASAMAADTDLDEDAWMDMAIAAFRGISVGKDQTH